MIIIATIGPIMLIHSLIMYCMATNSVLVNIFARNINSKPFITTFVTADRRMEYGTHFECLLAEVGVIALKAIKR